MVCLLDASVGVGMCWLGWAAGGTLKPPPILGGGCSCIFAKPLLKKHKRTYTFTGSSKVIHIDSDLAVMGFSIILARHDKKKNKQPPGS